MSAVLEPSAPATSAAYDARWQRIMDCVNLKQPDRLPTIFKANFWLAKYGGISYKELMFDYEKNKQISERAVLEFDPDAVHNPLTFTAMGPSMEAMGLKFLSWPGHGIGDNQPYQVFDRECMRADEYDEFIFDPTGYYIRKFLPQVAEVFEGFAHFPTFPALAGLRTVNGIRPFAKPEVRASLLRLLDAAQEVETMNGHVAEFAQTIKAHGYPLMNGAVASNPYDTVADYWRGAINIMKDLFRHKDKILASMDKVSAYMSDQTIAAAKASGNPIVFITTHWAADPFMSSKQFETFWWPPFRRQLLKFIDAGLIPMVKWEHDCSRRLETIGDVPAGKCIYWFERTANVLKAHEVLGDTVALRGGIETSTLATGTPQDVDAAVRSAVEKLWDRGASLILDCGVSIPDEAPVQNVRAMFDAARKYAG